MKIVEVVDNDKKINLPIEIDKDEIELNLIDELEDTLDLTDVLDNTMEVNLNE